MKNNSEKDYDKEQMKLVREHAKKNKGRQPIRKTASSANSREESQQTAPVPKSAPDLFGSDVSAKRAIADAAREEPGR